MDNSKHAETAQEIADRYCSTQSEALRATANITEALAAAEREGYRAGKTALNGDYLTSSENCYEAKAAAQADYERRVLAAIETQSSGGGVGVHSRHCI